MSLERGLDPYVANASEDLETWVNSLCYVNRLIPL